jgi:RHH-type transcriptional regulator, rel operon repressor / antitoxin RelB
MQEVITIRIEHDIKERLEKLAQATAHSRSFLAAEAIRCYLDQQAWQVEQIIDGLEEAEVGKHVEHEKVVRKWEARFADFEALKCFSERGDLEYAHR